MAHQDFPLYLAEINCTLLHMFRFDLPKEDIGRDDIEIYVEYGDEKEGVVPYNVWAQVKGRRIRSFLCPGTAPGKSDSRDIVQKIVFSLNSDEEFYDQVYAFIAHFDRSDS